jgi:hypothetical protein
MLMGRVPHPAASKPAGVAGGEIGPSAGAGI